MSSISTPKLFGKIAKSNLWSGRYLILLIILLLLFSCSLSIGAVSIPIPAVWQVLAGDTHVPASWQTIIWQFRFPKAITATFAGAALAVSGLQMQTLFQNALAGPYVLGLSSGASLGVALLVLGTGQAALIKTGAWSSVIAASLGAMVVMGLLAMIAPYVKSSISLLVIGLLLSYVTGAGVNILLFFSVPEQIQTYLNWTFGSFTTVTNHQLPWLVGVVASGLLLAMVLSKPLNLLLLGEDRAKSLGLSMTSIRLLITLNVSLLAGVVTAFCGPIAFLGVAVPHLARSLLKTSNLRQLIPMAAILGSMLALIADVLTQLPGTSVSMPLNSVTALLGAPIVIWVILRRPLL